MATQTTSKAGVRQNTRTRKSRVSKKPAEKRKVTKHQGRSSAKPRAAASRGKAARSTGTKTASKGHAKKAHRATSKKKKKNRRFDEKDQLLQRYFASVEQHSLLKREEELALARDYVKTKNPAAKERLINANLRLAAKVAYRYRNAYPDLLDLIQEANIGLIRAVDGYDPERGTRFTTYAAFWMRATVIRFILTHSRNVRIKSHKPGERKGPAREYSIDRPMDGRSEGKTTLGDTLVADGPSPEAVIAWDDLKSKVETIRWTNSARVSKSAIRFIFEKAFRRSRAGVVARTGRRDSVSARSACGSSSTAWFVVPATSWTSAG